jgi:predicted AAA+ superfamily ATPase
MSSDTRFVYVDVSADNESVLLPHLRQREPVPFVLLYGPRAAGKTTHMLRAMEQLPEFCCIQYVGTDAGMLQCRHDADLSSDLRYH